MQCAGVLISYCALSMKNADIYRRIRHTTYDIPHTRYIMQHSMRLVRLIFPTAENVALVQLIHTQYTTHKSYEVRGYLMW